MGHAIKPAINAFAITFGDRFPGRRDLLTSRRNTVSEIDPTSEDK